MTERFLWMLSTAWATSSVTPLETFRSLQSHAHVHGKPPFECRAKPDRLDKKTIDRSIATFHFFQ